MLPVRSDPPETQTKGNNMAKFDNVTVSRWATLAADWLAAKAPHITTDKIETGRDAWAVAVRCGITSDAYQDRTVTDGHIQTALEKIFPNAVFKDAKVY